MYSSTQWTALMKSSSHNDTAPQEHSDFCKNMQAIQHHQYRWQRINPESLFQVDHFKPSPHVASSQRDQANRHPSILSCAFWSRGGPLRPFTLSIFPPDLFFLDWFSLFLPSCCFSFGWVSITSQSYFMILEGTAAIWQNIWFGLICQLGYL